MDINEIIKSINSICLFIAVGIFLVIKFLKYLLSRENLKIKKSNSLFGSINSVSPNSQSENCKNNNENSILLP